MVLEVITALMEAGVRLSQVSTEVSGGENINLITTDSVLQTHKSQKYKSNLD